MRDREPLRVPEYRDVAPVKNPLILQHHRADLEGIAAVPKKLDPYAAVAAGARRSAERYGGEDPGVDRRLRAFLLAWRTALGEYAAHGEGVLALEARGLTRLNSERIGGELRA